MSIGLASPLPRLHQRPAWRRCVLLGCLTGLASSRCNTPAEAPPGGIDAGDVAGSTHNPQGHQGRSAEDGDSIYLNVLPPGSNGNSAGGIGLPIDDVQFHYPDHFRDSLDLYGDLAFAASPLRAEPCSPPGNADEHQKGSDLACNYFKHEGLTPDNTVSERLLTAPGGKMVTVRRDRWGVPFVEGEDRGAAMFGVGYSGAHHGARGPSARHGRKGRFRRAILAYEAANAARNADDGKGG